jgi:hypothetical protein
MSAGLTANPCWEVTRARLRQSEPGFYELAPGGALALDLDEEGWLLEVTPEERLICQTGVAMEDVKTLLSDGTCEDLGTDELAKQAKGYLNRTASKYRRSLLGAGFEERAEMNEEHVAVLFQRQVDFRNIDEVLRLISWCVAQFASRR